VAGALVLEATRPHRSTRRWPEARALIEWACLQIRKSKPGASGERAWFLASIALIEEARDWAFLWKVPETLLGTDFGKRTLAEHGPHTEHLAHAKARLVNEPRVLLAELLAREQDTWRLGALLPPGSRPLPGPLGDRRIPSDYERYLNSLITPETSGARVSGFRQSGRAIEAQAELKRLSTLVEVQKDYEKLTVYDSVRAEAWLRAGYGLVRLGKYQEAVDRFYRVRPSASEPSLNYLADYSSGWIFEQIKRPTDAIAAYRRALDATPRAPSASKRLAALLFEMDHRTEADRVFAETTDSPVLDPVSQFMGGDARLWPLLIEELRAQLK
jgi:tetratricopeptide (TPR) repeat protein